MSYYVRFAYVGTSMSGLVLDVNITAKGDDLCIPNLEEGEVSSYFSVCKQKILVNISQSRTHKGVVRAKCKLTGKYNTVVVSVPNLFSVYKDSTKCPSPGTALVRDLSVSDRYMKIKIPATTTMSTSTTTMPTMSNTTITFTTTTSTTIAPTDYISGGVYTIFSNTVTTHDNNASTVLPAQNCEKTVPCFDITKMSGKWYVVEELPTVTTSSLTITPLWEEVKIEVLPVQVQISTSTMSTTVSSVFLKGVQDRMSQIALENNVTLVVHDTDYKSYAIIGSTTRTVYYRLSRCKERSDVMDCEARKLGY